MSFLKKSNFIVSLLFSLGLNDIFILVLADELKLYDKNAWYMKWYYWVIGIICFFVPVLVMLMIFELQMLTAAAKKLNVAGSEIYATPYSWILLIIIPIIGWILLLVMYIYLNVWILVKLFKGEGEKYLI